MALRFIAASLAIANAVAFAPGTSYKIHELLSPLESTMATVPLQLDNPDKWIESLDFDEFGKEVTALGKELQANTGQEDVDHLNKMVDWRNIAAVIGVSTMWMEPNFITVLALSTWTYASWTMIAHHTSHGGYNRVDAGKFNSRRFALGSLRRRIEDWCDWMLPEAWNIEHNRLHHYHLGEPLDPDLVERNLSFLREMKIPLLLKYFIALSFTPIWKGYYYAPNTFKELQVNKWRKEGRELPKSFQPDNAITLRTLLFPKDDSDRAAIQVVNPTEFMTGVMLPFFITRFLLLPAPLLLIPGAMGPTLFTHAIANILIAECLTNIHGFITIVTNHAGSDLYKFDDSVKPKTGSFYVRQVVSSANYDTGIDTVDFMHGFLNYQIEHHVFPDLSMKQYQIAAPKLRKICEKYGVPYVKENVFIRLIKTLNIMVGYSSMREFPTGLEPKKDKARQVTWKSTNGAIDEEDEYESGERQGNKCNLG